jgi:N,N'-diacetyllegionaminate synthase
MGKSSLHEANTAAVARKSLVAACEIPKGTKLKREHITIKRPGTGLAPAMFLCVLGRTVRKNIRAGSLLNRGLLE